jgi:TonB family protein
VKYPREEAKQRVRGVVVVSFDIDLEGRVRNLKTVCASRESFERAAHDAVSQWIYDPITRDGRPIALEDVWLTIKFELPVPRPSNTNSCLAYEVPEAAPDVIPPRLVKRVRVKYPAEADFQRVTGMILIKVTVTKTGKVTSPRVVCADPEGVFEDSVMQAIMQWQYEPATENEKPVAYDMVVSVDFGSPSPTKETSSK